MKPGRCVRPGRWRERQTAVVTGVAEPEGAVRFDGEVVWRIELQPITIGHQRSHHAVGDHHNLQPVAAALAGNLALLQIQKVSVKYRLRQWRRQVIGEGAWRNQFLELVIPHVAEHQIPAIGYPHRSLDLGIDRDVRRANGISIDQVGELSRVRDRELDRGGVWDGDMKQPAEHQPAETCGMENSAHQTPIREVQSSNAPRAWGWTRRALYLSFASPVNAKEKGIGAGA